MFRIDDDYKIYHTRGDTADFNVTVTFNESSPEFEALFSIKKDLKDTDYLLQLPVVDGHIHISHEDTQELPFGNYYYDIQVHILDGTTEGKYVTAGPYRYHLKPDVTTGVENG